MHIKNQDNNADSQCSPHNLNSDISNANNNETNHVSTGGNRLDFLSKVNKDKKFSKKNRNNSIEYTTLTQRKKH